MVHRMGGMLPFLNCTAPTFSANSLAPYMFCLTCLTLFGQVSELSPIDLEILGAKECVFYCWTISLYDVEGNSVRLVFMVSLKDINGEHYISLVQASLRGKCLMFNKYTMTELKIESS